MARKRRTIEEVRTAGLAALYEKLGVVDAIRFIQLYHPGTGDYTKERQAAIYRGEFDDLVEEIHARVRHVSNKPEPERKPVGAAI